MCGDYWCGGMCGVWCVVTIGVGGCVVCGDYWCGGMCGVW